MLVLAVSSLFRHGLVLARVATGNQLEIWASTVTNEGHEMQVL